MNATINQILYQGRTMAAMQELAGLKAAHNQYEYKFLRSLCDPRWNSPIDCYNSVQKALVQKSAMAENSGVTGGYTTPVEYTTLLMESLDEYSVFRPRAFMIPMNSGEILCPRPATNATPAAGTTPFFGGLNFNWHGTGGTGYVEGSSLVESEPTFEQMSLRPKDLIGELFLSNQLIMDTGEAGELQLIKLFGRAAAWYEDYAYFNGNGTHEPLGILKSPANLSLSRATTAHVDNVDVAKMCGSLIPGSWSNAIWCASPSVLPDLFKITGFQQNETVVERHDGFAGMLMTRPLFITEKLPALGTNGDIVLFDPSLYVIGNRMETDIAASPHARFANYQTVYRVWRRCDGRPLLDASVTLADGSSTASSIVTLTA